MKEGTVIHQLAERKISVVLQMILTDLFSCICLVVVSC